MQAINLRTLSVVKVNIKEYENYIAVHGDLSVRVNRCDNSRDESTFRRFPTNCITTDDI